MHEVVDYLYNREYKGKLIIDNDIKKKIDEYYKIYGA